MLWLVGQILIPLMIKYLPDKQKTVPSHIVQKFLFSTIADWLENTGSNATISDTIDSTKGAIHEQREFFEEISLQFCG